MKGIVNRLKRVVSSRPDLLVGLMLGAATFLLYFRTMAPTVLDGDNGEFQFMGYILGVPHSSGYPLYVLLLKLYLLLTWGDVAFRVNLFAVICESLAIPFVYAVSFRLIRARVPAILATILLALTPSIWGGALETKPYAFHFLLGVLLLYLALRWHDSGRSRDFYALAFVYGLGLTNHHVIAFTAPALALIVWFNRARVNRTMIARGGLLVSVPLLLYAYIPIRANYFIAQQSLQNWQLYQREDAILKGTVTAYYINTPQGFINLITGLDNIFKLGFKSDAEQVDRSVNAINLVIRQFGFAGIGLAVLGAINSFRRDRKLWSILLVFAAGISFIALVLRGISTVYYFSLAYFILAIWIGISIDALQKWSSRLHRVLPYVVALIVLVLPLNLLATNYARLDESNNYAPRDFAQTVLNDNLAPNAVVIAPWEVSEPIHYFQFVQNQRPDLLVVNVNPASKQFETMIQNAHTLRRPFYLAQFNPELPTPQEPRTIQAIPLPLSQTPQPRYSLANARIVPETQVLGYDLVPNPPQPGNPMRIQVFYRATARMYPMYSAKLTLADITGKLWGEYSGFPGSFYFPTYRWYELGEYYRDTWSIHLPPDAPSGLYNIDLSWYEYDRDADTSNTDKENKVALGTIRVGDLSATNIAHPSAARIGDTISFLGWSGDDSIARGQSLPLDLFWRADQASTNSYTVFVHLVDSTGRVLADADSPPSSGLYPTDRWQTGEDVRDRHTLKIPSDIQPGNYSIEIGMYLPSTGARLPIASAAGQADKIVLTKVKVH